MAGSLYRCARCGGTVFRQPPIGKGSRYAKWPWHHHPSGYALRDAYGCDDRDIEAVRTGPEDQPSRPVPRTNPATFWDEVMESGSTEPPEPAEPKESHRGRKPAPGSPIARKQGCSCPKGLRGKWVMAGCVVHGVG